jgi:hypothetical protein
MVKNTLLAIALFGAGFCVAALVFFRVFGRWRGLGGPVFLHKDQLESPKHDRQRS